MNEVDDSYESVPGVPGILPEDETILWRGTPRALGILLGPLHGGLVAGYFAALAGWRVITQMSDGAGLGEAVASTWTLGAACALCLAILGLIAWLTKRTTIYTITSRRVLLRYGIALPMTVNLPLKSIEAADLKRTPGGTGDIALKLNENLGLGYIHLWPHARPWHLSRPEPMLRAIPAAERVGSILANAVRAAGIPATIGDRAVEQRHQNAGPAAAATA